MKIIQITPGTGNFHCGNCIRDEALVHGLRGLGHDPVMVPMYLPMVLDDTEATLEPRSGIAQARPETAPAGQAAPIFFGGINCYLQQKLAFFRRTPRWLDRWLDRPALLRWSAGKADMTSAHDLGEMMCSMLRGEEGHQLKELERLVEWLRAEGRPDVISLSNVMLSGLARRLKQALGVPVVCSLQGEDTFVDSLPEPWRSRAWALLRARARDVDAFVAVSHYYARAMGPRLELPESKLHVVHNGILLEGFAAPAETAAGPPPAVGAAAPPPVLGYLARLHFDKGPERLAEAFIELKRRPEHRALRLAIAGSATAGDQPLIDRLRARLQQAGVWGDVTLRTNLTRAEKIEFLRGLSVFCVPAIYGEAFGLYVLEALAAGVPVVQPRHGGFPEIIEATGGGVLAERWEPDDLADAIEGLLLDPARARALGEAGRRAVHARFGADAMARGMAEVFERVRDARGEAASAGISKANGKGAGRGGAREEAHHGVRI